MEKLSEGVSGVGKGQTVWAGRETGDSEIEPRVWVWERGWGGKERERERVREMRRQQKQLL